MSNTIKIANSIQSIVRTREFINEMWNSYFLEDMGFESLKDINMNDSFEDTGIFFYIENNSEIIGACRLNILNFDEVDSNFYQKFNLALFENEIKEFAYVSRLIFHKNHKNFEALTSILEFIDEYIKGLQMPITLMGCRKELLPLYRFMGFNVYHTSHIHPMMGIEVFVLCKKN